MIGILDSGVGGVAFLRRLVSSYAVGEVAYVADTGFLPYGEKSLEEIRERVRGLVRFLLGKGASAVVLACNTATAAAIDTLRQEFAIPIVGIEPAVKPAMAETEGGRVGIWVTPFTARSERFNRLLSLYGGEGKIVVCPCAGLADTIERWSDELRPLVQQYLSPISGVEGLVLGCTHYELIETLIAEEWGSLFAGVPVLRFFSPSEGAVRRLATVLELEPGVTATGRVQLFATSDTDFERSAARFLPGLPQAKRLSPVFRESWEFREEVPSSTSPWVMNSVSRAAQSS